MRTRGIHRFLPVLLLSLILLTEGLHVRGPFLAEDDGANFLTHHHTGWSRAIRGGSGTGSFTVYKDPVYLQKLVKWLDNIGRRK